MPELYTRTGLTKDLYSLIFKACFIFSFLIQILCSLFKAAIDNYFLLHTSSLSPNNDPSFFTVLHFSSLSCFVIFKFTPSVLSHLYGALIFLSKVVSSVFDSLTFRLRIGGGK